MVKLFQGYIVETFDFSLLFPGVVPVQVQVECSSCLRNTRKDAIAFFTVTMINRRTLKTQAGNGFFHPLMGACRFQYERYRTKLTFHFLGGEWRRAEAPITAPPQAITLLIQKGVQHVAV